MTRMSRRAIVVLDTCCVINLGAADELVMMLASIPFELWLPAVAAKEVLHVREPDQDDRSKLVERGLDLQPAIDACHLRICDLDAEEGELFVRFATVLDDGEASALAIAKHRGWTLATDDRKARRIADEAGVVLLSTPELMKAWADHTRPGAEEIKAVLTRIRDFARFAPRAGSPQSNWWSKHS